MIPRMFKGVTGILNAPRTWDEATMGDCDPLPYVYDHELHAYVSMWVPDADELARLNAGLPVRLMLLSPPPEPGVPHHPIVAVGVAGVGEVDDDNPVAATNQIALDGATLAKLDRKRKMTGEDRAAFVRRLIEEQF